MNCKPGELAFIMHAGGNDESWASGLVVRCLSVFMEGIYACWIIEKALVSPAGQMYTSVYDGVLKPIRDPGDDAIDESKAWLPPVPLPAIDPSLIPEKESIHAQ